MDRQEQIDKELATKVHNHKENMAGIATAFYVSAALVIGYAGKHPVLSTVLLSLSAPLILCYLNSLYTQRWIAAEMAAGLDPKPTSALRTPMGAIRALAHRQLDPRLMTELPSNGAVILAATIGIALVW